MAVFDGLGQFRDVFNTVKAVEASVTFTSVATGASQVQVITVPGVTLGDFVIAESLSVDQQGVDVESYVSAANVVTVMVQNTTGGAVNFGTVVVRLVVATRQMPFSGAH